jgi:hypothetical protein
VVYRDVTHRPHADFAQEAQLRCAESSHIAGHVIIKTKIEPLLQFLISADAKTGHPTHDRYLISR